MIQLLVFTAFLILFEIGLFVDMRLLNLKVSDAMYFLGIDGTGMIITLISVYIRDIKTIFTKKEMNEKQHEHS